MLCSLLAACQFDSRSLHTPVAVFRVILPVAADRQHPDGRALRITGTPRRIAPGPTQKRRLKKRRTTDPPFARRATVILNSAGQMVTSHKG